MAFYAAYVYFEKLRLKEGKKKSKKRQEMVSNYRACSSALRSLFGSVRSLAAHMI